MSEVQPTQSSGQIIEIRQNAVVVYVDGGVNPNPGSGAIAAVVGDGNGEIIIEQAKKIERATNNEAEYRSLLLGINLAHLVGAREAHFCCDSMLVVQQVSGWWAINGGEMARFHAACTSSLMLFDSWSIQHVPRAGNQRADYLCNELMDHKSKRQLREKPGIEFRAGQARDGWYQLGYDRPRAVVAGDRTI